jgi:hypothetical protein
MIVVLTFAAAPHTHYLDVPIHRGRHFRQASARQTGPSRRAGLMAGKTGGTTTAVISARSPAMAVVAAASASALASQSSGSWRVPRPARRLTGRTPARAALRIWRGGRDGLRGRRRC